MDKETLSNYGWIVICVLVLAVMLALATPFGSFISDAIWSTTNGLFDVQNSALNTVGLSSTIPAGGKYTTTDGTVLEEGDKFPQNIGLMDTYAFGDYTYYPMVTSGNELGASTLEEGLENLSLMLDSMDMTLKDVADMNGVSEEEMLIMLGLTEDTFVPSVLGGWGVGLNLDVTDKNQTSYGEILSSVAGKPIVSLSSLFSGCKNLTISPVLPDTVTDMFDTFYGCESLSSAPKLPRDVKVLVNTFFRNYSLTSAPTLPYGVTEVSCAFAHCTSLKTYHGSTDPDGDFSNYVIPNSVTDMDYFFNNCPYLVKAPNIPNSVVTLQCTFISCTNLTTAPAIPNSVTNMWGTFQGCTSLTGTITINTNHITTKDSSVQNTCYTCFSGVNMNNITLTGEASKEVLNLIGSTGQNWTPIE